MYKISIFWQQKQVIRIIMRAGQKLLCTLADKSKLGQLIIPCFCQSITQYWKQTRAHQFSLIIFMNNMCPLKHSLYDECVEKIGNSSMKYSSICSEISVSLISCFLCLCRCQIRRLNHFWQPKTAVISRRQMVYRTAAKTSLA